MSNMGSSTSHRRAAGETSEWEDILRKKGITTPSAEELALQAAAAEQAERMAEEASRRIDPLAAHGVAALDRLEEEGGEFADSRALEGYRERRLAELKARAALNRFGELRPLARSDFVAEVSEASKEAWVVVFLHQSHVPDSQLLARALAPLAPRHAATKFLSIKADACIENYPDRNVPTLLLYHDGVLQSQVVGLAELGGPRVSEQSEHRRCRRRRRRLPAARERERGRGAERAASCAAAASPCEGGDGEIGGRGRNFCPISDRLRALTIKTTQKCECLRARLCVPRLANCHKRAAGRKRAMIINLSHLERASALTINNYSVFILYEPFLGVCLLSALGRWDRACSIRSHSAPTRRSFPCSTLSEATEERIMRGAGRLLQRGPLLTAAPNPLPSPSFAVVEWVLARRGAVKTELEDDPREARAARPAGFGRGGGGGGAGSGGRRGDEDEDEEDEDEGAGRRR
jgi:hypothetical protein